MCAEAFNAMAETSCTVGSPNFTPFFASIQLSFEEFDKWRRARRYIETRLLVHARSRNGAAKV